MLSTELIATFALLCCSVAYVMNAMQGVDRSIRIAQWKTGAGKGRTRPSTLSAPRAIS